MASPQTSPPAKQLQGDASLSSARGALSACTQHSAAGSVKNEAAGSHMATPTDGPAFCWTTSMSAASANPTTTWTCPGVPAYTMRSPELGVRPVVGPYAGPQTLYDANADA